MKWFCAASLAAIVAAAPAAPAAAQDLGDVVGAIAGTVVDALTPDEVRRLPIDERQAWIERRIQLGLSDGSLTRLEAQRLRNESRELARVEAAYRRDGITRAEWAELDRRFDRLSTRVYNQRHDLQERNWASIDQRQARLEDRIQAGLRSGQLTAREATRLRYEFRDIARLERRYRTGGLSTWERADLDRRFDLLSAQIRIERGDSQDRAWVGINQRQERLDSRIDAGVRTGELTRAEAQHLRSELRELARLERRYLGGGLSGWEQADLDRRFDALSSRVRADRSDAQTRDWVGINARQAELDRRIDAGVSDGSLTAREAERLRDEFRDLARLEARYRVAGLSAWERSDLDVRFDRLRNQIRAERYDRQARAR